MLSDLRRGAKLGARLAALILLLSAIITVITDPSWTLVAIVVGIGSLVLAERL